jgi:hypothetical protein
MAVRQTNRNKLLRKLLLRNSKSSGRLWASLIALCIGTTLLLLSVMIWWNFQQLLQGREENDSLGSTFLTVSKKITNSMMGKPGASLFSEAEINSLRSAPQVQDIGQLTANRFPVYAVLNADVGFATDMFLEAVPDRFIDNRPEDWYWQPSSQQVPLIVSAQFLDLYNYGFAPSQGLPQLSESSIQSLAFELRVGPREQQKVYLARVVGFSDRITSVLAPQSFIDHGNQSYTGQVTIAPSRLIVKAKDPSDKTFVEYLEKNGYNTNSEQLRWNKVRVIVEIVSAATGLLAVLLLGIGALVFVLFIELTISRAQASITLLLQLGYSPRYISIFMMRRFFPLLMITLIISMALAALAQMMSAHFIKSQNLIISQFPGWPVWAALGISTVFLLILVSRSIVRAIGR